MPKSKCDAVPAVFFLFFYFYFQEVRCGSIIPHHWSIVRLHVGMSEAEMSKSKCDAVSTVFFFCFFFFLRGVFSSSLTTAGR